MVKIVNCGKMWKLLEEKFLGKNVKIVKPQLFVV